MKLTLLKHIALFALVCIFKCDIPTHCLKEKVIGQWDFKATKPEVMTNNQLYQFTCGHENPSKPRSAYKTIDGNLSNFTETFSITLQANEKVIYKDKEGTNEGTWTMVYDEGFDIHFDRQNKNSTIPSSYFSFLKYGKNKNYSGITSKWASFCYGTLVGWYHIGNSWGCFYGSKTGHDPNIPTNGEANNKQFVVQPTRASLLERNQKFLAPPKVRFMESTISEGLQLNSEFTNHELVVEAINSSDGLWKAENYEVMHGYSIGQLNNLLFKKKYSVGNLKKKKRSLIEDIFHHLNFFPRIKTTETETYEQRLKRIENEKDLPQNFSWISEMSTPKSQGSCGSCYAMATLSMLEARFRIMYKSELLKYFHDLNDFSLSIDHVLQCSYYNQGCEGGYSYLTSKFFNEIEIILDKCFKKQNHTINFANSSNFTSCSNQCEDENLKKLELRVKDYYYCGGAYGKTNEQNLMEELYKNGPLVISFEPNYKFMMYKSGIFDDDGGIANWFFKKDPKPNWQKVDHSIVLVGWGEETVKDKEVKYWLIQNSWGTKWGQGGYGKFLRGVDLNGIESIGEVGIPLLKIIQ